MALTDGWIVLQVAVIFVLLNLSECTVTSVSPRKGGENGGCLLTIYGNGFAANQFNFGADSAVGNKVTLVSGKQQHDCPVHKDGSNAKQVQCHTPPLKQGTYKVRVAVDGTDLGDNNLEFTSSSANTPTITSVEPRSGPPGTIVKLCGKIFTDMYGSNMAESSNGRTARILRVYAGGQNCELQDANGNFHGITLKRDEGCILCKIGVNGTKMGNINASLLISDQFCRAKPSNAYVPSGNGQLYMFQTYAEITSVSPNTGSVEGGTLISITGKNFDETRSSPVVMVGGMPCTVKGAITKTLVTCETASKPASAPAINAGNRGLKWEIWNATQKTANTLGDVADLESTAADYFTADLGDASYSENSMANGFVARTSGFFMPPADGEYSFGLQADGVAELHFSSDDSRANMAKIASSGSPDSDRILLSSSSKYYLELYHAEGTSASWSTSFFKTDMTRAYTDNSKPEVQKVVVRSATNRESQTITPVDFTTGTSTSAVQEVTVVEKTSGQGGQLRLALYSTYTDLINYQASASTVAAAINNLAVFEDGETVTVTEEMAGGSGSKYTITFNSDRGNFQLFSVNATDSLTVTVTEQTTGIPSGALLALSFGGVPVPPVPIDATSPELEAALGKLFSTGCPRKLSKPTGGNHHKTYESADDTPSYNRNNRYSEVEAFCGKYVLKSPTHLFKTDKETYALSMTLNPKICFGHQGPFRFSVRASYDIANEELETTLEDVITSTDTTEWEYSCVNILAALNGKVPAGSGFYLQEAYLEFKAGFEDVDYYIDELYMGTKEPTTDKNVTMQRHRQPKLNGEDLIASATVVKQGSSFSVTLVPRNCGYNFPVFTTQPGQIPAGATVTVTQVQTASPRLTGTFDVELFGSTVTQVPINSTAEELAEILSTVEGNDDVTVTFNGDCANFDWTITYNSLPGDQSQIKINAGNVAGDQVTMAPETLTDGHMHWETTPGEFLSSPNEKAQVAMLNNDIPTKCSGTCDFEWLTSSTPTLTSIAPGTGASGTVAAIVGTGFSGTPADNSVMIGGIACAVTASTSTSITCTTGSGPAGTHKVDVNVAGSGLAQQPGSGDVNFINPTGISSFLPASSSLGGGVNLTVDGYGFSNDATVTVAGQGCPVIYSSPDQLVCVIPPKTSAGAVAVAVAMAGVATSTASNSFTYDAGIAAQISSSTPTTSGVKGGATLTIDGSGFGSSGIVKIGGTVVSPSSYSNTQVTVILPTLSPGLHPVEVIVGTDGAAVLTSTNAVPTVNYVLKVTNVCPLQGSLHGGTKVTITGDGLGADAEVKIGGHSCDVDAATAMTTQIVCTIGDTGTIHLIDNSGTDPVGGKGFAWKPKNLAVKEGDSVRAEWGYEQFVEQKIIFEETGNATATTPKPNGFSSGPTPTKNGLYQHKLNTLGRKYYWSGFLDSNRNTSFRGSVDVVALNSFVGDVSVEIDGKEAEYETSGSAQCVTSGCPGPAPSGGDPAKFNFNFLSCLTPTITSINRNNGTANDDIVLTGTGLSQTLSQNKVMFGSDSCIVSAASSSSVTCKLDSSSSPPVGVPQSIDVRVGILGSARIAIAGQKPRTFAAIPVVSSFSPVVGSLEGNTQLTIVGGGFQGTIQDVDVTVTVGGYPCPITSFSYTNIVCSTANSNTDGAKAVEVKVKAGGQMVPAECDANSCDFTYDLGSTASLESVSPTTVDGSSTTLTITGKRLGSSTGDVSVTVGGEVCTVTEAAVTSVKCTISAVPVGSQSLLVDIAQKGLANSLTVTSQAVISTVSPAVGSTNGGTHVTVIGNGFDSGAQVTIDGTDCPVASSSLSQIVCVTAAHVAENDVALKVTSGGIAYADETFSYTVGATPVVASLSPTSGSSGDTVTISGTNLGPTIPDNAVTLGGRACVVTSASATEIACTVGNYGAGSYGIVVDVAGSGLSNDDQTFTFSTSASSISPNSGSASGDQAVTIAGSGFDDTTSVTICSQACVQSATQTSSDTQYFCITPAASGTGTQVCSVVVTTNSITQTLSYTYDSTKTPTITAVAPRRGGTGGGTSVTVSGSGFGTTPSDCAVSIEGSVCVVNTVSDTQIVCDTGAISASVRGKVRVEIAGNGQALATQNTDNFHYVDVWSSVHSWGGVSVPKDGDLVVIQDGQTILLDTQTAVLKMLLIQGGEVIFDDNQDVALDAEYILVINNGLFQVGTETEPFQHNAVITLHGHVRSQELPLYGAKMLAVRNGTLDMHGIPKALTWTTLSQTAIAGSNTINLDHPVPDWHIGDKVVIATTGDHTSQGQTETKTITAKSNNDQTLTLDSVLEHDHLSVVETYGSGADVVTVPLKGEVGLLTRNVQVRGSRDLQWAEDIEACPDGFDTGEFATQTCFQGRFGEEKGSDQFGGHILLHSPEPDSGDTIGRISYIELYYMGQSFKLGRYPVHFHLLGDASHSYVRGLGIHETFNRAVNVHATHYLLVERNVIYNVMGGSVFLEDGIENNNTIQYNLIMFAIASTSLLNDDITPACIWVTNPLNFIRHNAVAGGSHFGIWYSFHEHPTGPSHTTDVCPDKGQLGEFYNNTAHSFGWFGLWIFPTYTPREGGGCGSTSPKPALFDTFNSWHNEKGAESVNQGHIQFSNFVMTDNEKAGFEIKLLVDPESPNGAAIKDSVVIARSSGLGNTHSTEGGLVLPYGHGLQIDNITFVNFNEPRSCAFTWTRIDGTCNEECGGFTHTTSQLKFDNSPCRTYSEWEFEGILEDLDGSLCNSPSCKVIPKTDILPAASCGPFAHGSSGIDMSVCSAAVKLLRIAINNVMPTTLLYKTLNFTSEDGSSLLAHRDKRITHKEGYQADTPSKKVYSVTWVDAPSPTNFSFTAQMDHVGDDDWVIWTFPVKRKPNRMTIISGEGYVDSSETSLDPLTARRSQWFFDDTTDKLNILIRRNTEPDRRKKRSSPKPKSNNESLLIEFDAFTCYYFNCTPPPDPETVPPATVRPSTAVFWSRTDSWPWLNNTLPVAGTDLTIPEDTWMVADMAIPSLNTVTLRGVLEADHGTAPYRDFTLSANHIIIIGGRLIVGWPDAPYLGNALLNLRGNWASEEYSGLPNAPTAGAKAIAVFGGIDLHGIDVGVSWTRLAATAVAGDSTITLAKAVNWTAGSDIVLATTGYLATETEYFKIVSRSADGLTLSLNKSLEHRHVFVPKENAASPDLGAEVGLLSRNVKVVGEDYDKLYKESFGARVLVSRAQDKGKTYTGFGRFNNVQFDHTGQEGWVDSYDPRYSVAFLDTGDVSDIKPSYLTSCAFSRGFAPAIGAFGINGLTVADNTVTNTVWKAITTNGNMNQLLSNLVVNSMSEATYQDRWETENLRLGAAFELKDATNLYIDGNVCAGGEKACYWLNAMECGSNGYGRNLAHSSAMGFAIFPDDDIKFDCVQISNLTAWKNHDAGFYYQNKASLEMLDLKSVENIVGIAVFVFGPTAEAHEFAYKHVSFRDSQVVGATSTYDCTSDRYQKDEMMRLNSQSLTYNQDGSHIGMMTPLYTQADNGIAMFPYYGIMAYPSIQGITRLDNVTFSHFNEMCGHTDFAITSNPQGDDGQHPMESKRLTLNDVAEGSKLFYFRPDIGRINGADCVDMDCDGAKKNLFIDLDGSFFGRTGSAVSESEWEWDGDARRGLGDYRIPKTLLADKDGKVLTPNEVAPERGIIRNADCVYKSAWQAHECQDLTYRMLIIESMDSDTETRRLSPVAIVGDGYLDLINGPQDHGWCSGYTCRKRLSTFMFLVATGKEYKIHFTGTSPQHIRIFLLNSEDSDAIKLKLYYSQPYRIDVSAEGQEVLPTNGRYDGDSYVLDAPTYSGEFDPSVSTGTTGQNYFDGDTKYLDVIIKGKEAVELKTKVDAVIVSFDLPPMTVDEFFGPQVIKNLAAFFGISSDKIRVMSIVKETAVGRRKRSTSNDKVVLEVSDPPGSNSSALTPEQLENMVNTLSQEVQLGNISEVLNVTVVGVGVAAPAPAPSSPEWNATTTDSPAYTVIVEAASMRFNPAPKPQHEGVVFKTQPKIQVLDVQGQPITQLGTTAQPWQITASLRPGGSNPSASLTGNLTITFVNGWANYTDLLITQSGTDFYIDFNLTVPADSNFTIASEALTIVGRPIKASVASMTSTVIEKEYFSISVELRDNVTTELIPDIAWRGHTWTLTAELNKPELHTGSMMGSNETIFSTSSSSANFYSLNFTSLGVYAVKLHIYTTPAGYDFYEEVQVIVRSQAQTSIVVEETKLLVMKFDSDYTTVVGADDKPFASMMANYFLVMYPGVLFNSVSIEAGSIVVTFAISGGISGVNTTVYGMCDTIQSGSSFTFNSQSITLSGYLTVGGVSYYGVHCGDIATTTTPASDLNETSLALIIAGVVVSFTLLVIVVAIIIWKCKVHPKTKTMDLSKFNGYESQPKTIEDILFREQSFMSIREKSAGLPQAPAATNINSLGYGYYSDKKSPLPF